MKKCDLHVHTHFSFDIRDGGYPTIDKYAELGISLGVDVICFTDHIERNERINTFDNFLYEERLQELREAREKYDGRIKLLQGFEVGNPHLHQDAVKQLRDMGVDMIIGSIHFSEIDGHFTRIEDKNEWERWYDLEMLKMVECGNFDVLGHLDILKKWHGKDYIPDTEKQKEAIRIAVEKGLVPEINTSGLRGDLHDVMPGWDMVGYYRECGGKYLTVNSDAHRIADLFADCEDVMAKIPEGMKLCYFEGGKLVEA